MTASLSPEQKADEGAGRAPSGPALAATPSSPSVSPLTGFDPSRVMSLFCSVANARYALEYWDREVRWASGARGHVPDWACGPAQRGLQECDTLREIEAFLRRLIARDTDEHPQGEDPEGLSGEAMPAGAEGIAKSPQESTHD